MHLAQLVDEAIQADVGLRQRYKDCPSASGGRCSTLIDFVRDRPGHDLRYANDTSKISQVLGFKPEVDLQRGLANTLLWYLEHYEWWHRRLLADQATPVSLHG
jgi:dTDP-glucose 4,6-dehydratase